jgi:hypothetical protein
LNANRQTFMRRAAVSLGGLIPILTMAACGGGGPTAVRVAGDVQTYHDSSGWSITVPAGWRAVHFSDSKNGVTSAGVQLSNVRLPVPSLLPGYPIQVNGRVLPARGVGLIIATDTDPKLPHNQVAMLPLTYPDGRYWMAGSAPAGSSYMDVLWFRVHGMTFIATAKIGPRATKRSLKAVATAIRSLR